MNNGLTEVMRDTQMLFEHQHDRPAPEIAVRRTMADHHEASPKLRPTANV
jgi:hypothetical protein